MQAAQSTGTCIYITNTSKLLYHESANLCILLATIHPLLWLAPLIRILNQCASQKTPPLHLIPSNWSRKTQSACVTEGKINPKKMSVKPLKRWKINPSTPLLESVSLLTNQEGYCCHNNGYITSLLFVYTGKVPNALSQFTFRIFLSFLSLIKMYTCCSVHLREESCWYLRREGARLQEDEAGFI